MAASPGEEYRLTFFTDHQSIINVNYRIKR